MISRKWELSSEMDKEFEWEKWRKEIPYINFLEHFLVQIIPPFTGAIIRFVIKHRDYKDDTWISVYLDCYGLLGAVNSPYWELYPYKCEEYEDVYRCGMNDIDELIKKLDEQLKVQIANSIHNKVKDNPSKFYTYSQNNSGGYFKGDDNICEYVIIEAKSSEHANNIAESIGIYFNGVSEGIDCSCCGDRWDMTDDKDGEDEPMIYKTPVKEVSRGSFRDKCIIHYLNGTKEIISFSD